MLPARRRIIVSVAAVVAVLATALAGSMALAAAPQPADAASGRSVSVNGSAQVTLKPDIAYVSFGTLTQNADATAARDANNKLMAKVVDALKAQGIDADKDVKTTNYSVNPRYDTNGTKIIGYEINNSIQVKVRDLNKLGAVMDAAVAAGANLAGGLYFDVENREDAYNQALEQAVADARARAETLAKSAGAALGAVTSASENGGYTPPGPIYYARDAAMDGAGSVPVSSGTLTVSASVSVTFELQ